jgi:peroxiredoxin
MTKPPAQTPPKNVADAMRAAVFHGQTESLDGLSRRGPVLVVFLRHLGCTFCREALADVARHRASIEADGTRIVLVHMGPTEEAGAFFARYGLEGVEQISDPTAALYRSFGLRRGNLWQLFGPRVAWRGLMATLAGHKVGRLRGDGFQMPGVFLVRDGRIIREFKHRDAGQRPDYTELAVCPLPTGG